MKRFSNKKGSRKTRKTRKNRKNRRKFSRKFGDPVRLELSGLKTKFDQFDQFDQKQPPIQLDTDDVYIGSDKFILDLKIDYEFENMLLLYTYTGRNLSDLADTILNNFYNDIDILMDVLLNPQMERYC